MAKRRKQRVIIDITLSKPVAERTAVSFMREVLLHIDWNEREYLLGLYADRVEAKSFLRVVDGIKSQGNEIVEIGVPDGPNYDTLREENERLRAALAKHEDIDPSAVYDGQTIDF